ncbi:glycosyltransferase [Falsibacillus albus]|uniref:Glycosyltransferase n=1 Tax=Falsibacillus albus TaxID=2478915 RepID=A0A3L7K2I0_9BACI|nr:glycosyltransferase [Falsibacillus albus]RLQ96825.1 glycosyltransferase [Falsibacillus albus]
MKVVHMISGGETGGSRKHVVTLLSKLPKEQVCLIVFQEGSLAEEARQAGVRVELFKQNSRYDLSILSRLVSFINEEKFDILHTHGPRANLFASWIKKKLNAVWMTTIHSDPKLDFMKSGLKGWVFTKLNLSAIRKIDYFFAVSQRFKDNLMEFGIPDEKIQTVYNGIDFSEPLPAALDKKKELNLPEQAMILTMTARLHPVKGHEIVFDALKRLHNPNIHLLLVGDGPIREELEGEIRDLKLQDRVTLAGFRKDVKEIFTISDLSLLASYSESFPLVLLEAANEQVPIITTDVGGVHELIDSGDKGWIVPVGDASAYAKAIDAAYNEWNSGTLTEKGEKLRDHAVSHFSLDHLAALIWKVYKEKIN